MGQTLIAMPKAVYPEYWVKSDMSHSDESIIGKWYKVHKSEIKLHNGDICQIWGMQIFFYAIGKGWGSKRAFLGREMNLKNEQNEMSLCDTRAH